MRTLTEILLAVYALFMLVISVGLSLTIPIILVVASVAMASLLTVGLIRGKLPLIFIGVLGLIPTTLLNNFALYGSFSPIEFVIQMSFSFSILICAHKFLRESSIKSH